MDIRKFSLRNFRDYPVNLHWLILLATVPGFIALALISFLAYQGVRERLESELTHTVRALTLAVDRELSGELLALHALAASSALASERLDGFYQEAKNFQSADSVVNHIVLTDRSGQELVNTLKPFGSPLPRTNNMERIDRVFATASSSVSKLLLGTSSGTHVIVVDTPVMRDGHVIYDLAMVIDPAKLGSILKSQHLPESWGAGIVDQEGVLIARTPNPERFVGRRAAPSWLELSAKHREGTVEALSLDGIPVLGAFCHSEVTDYTVGIAMPMAAVRASLARSVAMASLGVASLIATGFWIAMRLNRRILKSIRSIADAALAAEHGQLDTSLSVAGPAELTQLSEQIGRVLHSRHDAELHLARTNRALRLVSECIGALVHATDEHQLLAEICSHVVATGGYQMAWVGYPEHDPEKTVRPVAHAGNVQDYFAHIQVSWGDGVLGLGPTGTAIRTGSTQVNQNTLIDPRKRPWRQAALDRGYASSIALPLASEHEILGALTIYAAEADAFQGVEIELLEQLAADLEGRLTPLMADGRPYRLSAREALAYAKLMAGKTSEARDDFVYLTQVLDASQGLRQRAGAAVSLIDSGSAAAIPAAVKAAAALPPPAPAMPGELPPGFVPPGAPQGTPQ